MKNSYFIRHICSSMILTLGIQAKLSNICRPEKRGRHKKQVSYMLQHSITEPSCSVWSSLCLLVAKTNGDDRFCVHFRKVNSLTKPDCYLLPCMEDSVDRVGGAQYVTKLDPLAGDCVG